jgi:hypothetical protein
MSMGSVYLKDRQSGDNRQKRFLTFLASTILYMTFMPIGGCGGYIRENPKQVVVFLSGCGGLEHLDLLLSETQTLL